MLTMTGGASAQWISYATCTKESALIFLALSTRRVPCTLHPSPERIRGTS
jgi:hypothetical protein